MGRRRRTAQAGPRTDIRTFFARHGLLRSRHRLLGGVCAGVGRRLGLTPWVTRLLFLLLLVIPGSQLVIYPVLWVLMPDESRVVPGPVVNG